MLTTIKTYLGLTNTSKDSLLQILIDNAIYYFQDVCNIEFVEADHKTIIVKMVVEDFNRLGSEGISSLTFGSSKEATNQEYSDGLSKQIRKYKRAKVL